MGGGCASGRLCSALLHVSSLGLVLVLSFWLVWFLAFSCWAFRSPHPWLCSQGPWASLKTPGAPSPPVIPGPPSCYPGLLTQRLLLSRPRGPGGTGMERGNARPGAPLRERRPVASEQERSEVCRAAPCCAVPHHAMLSQPGPASCQPWPRGEALIPGWARGNCLSAGCSPGTAGMQFGASCSLVTPSARPLGGVKGKESHRRAERRARGQATGAAGSKLSMLPQHGGGPWLTPSPPPPPRHLLFCRDFPQSAEAEAEEQPEQHGVARQREPGERGSGADGEAPVLRGPLSRPGTPGSPRGSPQPRDVPVAWSWVCLHADSSGHRHGLVSPSLRCHPCPGAVGTSSPRQRPNSAISRAKHQCRELCSVCFVFAGP